jgi:HrpA-like RNA helicase
MFLLERNQIIILIGETGSGKSTQVLKHAHQSYIIVLKESNVVTLIFLSFH